jgi:hypothetical protein
MTASLIAMIMAQILPDSFGRMLMMHAAIPHRGGWRSFCCKFAADEKLLIVGSTICCGSAATLFRPGLLSPADAGIRRALDSDVDMPKLKTKSGAKKRFGRTATGKINLFHQRKRPGAARATDRVIFRGRF